MTTTNDTSTWRTRVHRAINALCRQSYLQANQLPNGKLRCKHVPYSVPQEAIDLLDCLKRNDESTAKAMMMHDYTISKLTL